MRPDELEVGDCFVHDARQMPCLVTRKLFHWNMLIGYEYVPWRGEEWAEQTMPPRIIKLVDALSGDRINFETARKVFNPKIRIVEV